MCINLVSHDVYNDFKQISSLCNVSDSFSSGSSFKSRRWHRPHCSMFIVVSRGPSSKHTVSVRVITSQLPFLADHSKLLFFPVSPKLWANKRMFRGDTSNQAVQTGLLASDTPLVTPHCSYYSSWCLVLLVSDIVWGVDSQFVSSVRHKGINQCVTKWRAENLMWGCET